MKKQYSFLNEKASIWTKMSHFGKNMMKNSDRIGEYGDVAISLGLKAGGLGSMLYGSKNGLPIPFTVGAMLTSTPAYNTIQGLTKSTVNTSGKGIKKLSDYVRLRKIKKYLANKKPGSTI